MSRAVPLSTIHKAVRDGIVDAAAAAGDRFGMWLNEFPEYYVTARVADHLARTLGDRGWVHLEQQKVRVLKAAGAECRGRPTRSLPPKAQFDLTVYYLDERPRAVVEIKSPVYAWNTQVERDVDRICTTLQRTRDLSSLQCGIIGWYTDASVPERIDRSATARVRRYFEEWEEKASNLVASRGLHVEFVRSKVGRTKHPDGEGYEAWAAWAAMIRK